MALKDLRGRTQKRVSIRCLSRSCVEMNGSRMQNTGRPFLGGVMFLFTFSMKILVSNCLYSIRNVVHGAIIVLFSMIIRVAMMAGLILLWAILAIIQKNKVLS